MTTGLPPLAVYLVSGQLAEVPPADDWLAETEREVLARFRIEKRRGEWRLGRWLARRAVAAVLAGNEQDTSCIDRLAIVAAGDGAPEVHGAGVPITLSISHSHGRGLAVAALGATPLGCDLELIEPRSERFIRDWLTSSESELVMAASPELRPLLANLCWSGKESASKVLRVGLRFDTRSFAAGLPEAEAAAAAARTGEWQPFGVTALKASQSFAGYWRARAGFVETVLASTSFAVNE